MGNLADVAHAIDGLAKAVEGVGSVMGWMFVAYIFFGIFGGSSCSRK